MAARNPFLREANLIAGQWVGADGGATLTVTNPATGEVLPDGEKGELVFTSLTKEAMPVIRYRTRDLTRLLPGTARSMRRMEKVTGRSDDMMIIRGVNVFPTQIEEKLLTIHDLSLHYQLVLTRDGRMDNMEIQVEARPDASFPAREAATTASGTSSRPRGNTARTSAGSTGERLTISPRGSCGR